MSNIFLSIEEGLIVILNHFQEPIFPRTISTKATEGRQVLVNGKEQALEYFKIANYQDCRISAYPYNVGENPSAVARFQGIRKATPANIIILIDLDRCNFKTDRALELALFKTLQTLKEKLDAVPTVIWSGRGYHIIQVIETNGVNLEHEEIFSKLTNQPSRSFLQFAEGFLSNGKSDKSHNSTVSFRNCMLRVPGSINSKNGQAVQVKMQWNGYRPAINYLLSDFCVYLADQTAAELREQQRWRPTQIGRPWVDSTQIGAGNYRLQWIERLLQTPIADGRKYAIWRILMPYLINRRHMLEEQCTSIIVNWLGKCGQLSQLRFNGSHRVKDAIKHVRTYGPVYPDKMKQEYPKLYDLLLKHRVLL